MAVDTVEQHDVHDEHAIQEDWGGGARPFKASYGKLMMWYFLLSDAFTFAGFLISYGALRFSTPTWPVPDFVFKSLPFLEQKVVSQLVISTNLRPFLGMHP